MISNNHNVNDIKPASGRPPKAGIKVVNIANIPSIIMNIPPMIANVLVNDLLFAMIHHSILSGNS